MPSNENRTPSTRKAEREAARGLLTRSAEALRLGVDPAKLDRLVDFSDLLADWAPRMNLTGHRGAAEIAQRLVADALALICALPPYRRLADLGSGAGIPGLPLAILFPDRQLISVESRARRVAFQRTVVRELGLENVQIRHGRIEELEPEPGDAVIAQALAAPVRARELMLPWVVPGGWLAIPGTPESLAAPLPASPGCEPGEIRPYRVPVDGLERRVWFAIRSA